MKALLVLPLCAACTFAPSPGGSNDGGGDARRDSGPDAKVYLDARITDASDLCFGADPYLVCVASPPADALVFDAETIDTDEIRCAGPTHSGTVIDLMNGGRKLCVFAGTSIDVNARLRAEGDLPLVLLASGNLNVNTNGYVDVSSYRSNPERGAAADDGGCTITNGQSDGGGGGGGGGAGGSFGGPGGTGAQSAAGRAGGTTSVPPAPTFLRGSDGGSSGNGSGSGGASGGATYLLAKGDLGLAGKIDASGAGGLGGPAKGGGGGGGSGGMIVLYAGSNITLDSTARIWANGGGGGGGGDSNSSGGPGEQSLEPTVRAVGGNGGGGEGSSGAIGGEPGAQTSGKGGGAGGGGAGVIVNVKGQALSSIQISPSPRGP